MIKDSSKKIKLLKLHEILQQESEPNNPLTTEMLIGMLDEVGIVTDRITLRRDIIALREYGIDVHEKRVGHQKGYFLEENLLSVAEIKILMDAIQAASFISPDQTKELTNKLLNMSGTRRKDILDHSIVCFNTRKHDNPVIYENVGTLEKALRKKVQVSFNYFDINEKKERVYRKNGKEYVVDPIALIFHEDNYYLMTYSVKYDSIVNYRVDRIDNVKILDSSVSEKAILPEHNLSEYTKQAFKMYNGRIQSVSIEFEDTLLNPVYDKFGEDISVVRIGNNKLVAAVDVQVSPTFMGWVFQFGKGMKIVSPESLKEEYQEKVKELIDI